MVINFNAGPAAMPLVVKEQYAADIHNLENTPWSILELPHRSKEFLKIIDESKEILKHLLSIPDNYEVIWMQGGGRHQFGLVPMNFLPSDQSAAYVDSGHWAREAINYALYYGRVNIVSSSEEANYSYYPIIPQLNDEFNYLHLTTNNTIYGTQITNVPYSKVPIIADMSSDILSRKIEVSKYSMIYAAAQKNIGPAGATLVIIDKYFASNIKRPLPGIYTYDAFIKSNSVYNTAPVSTIYACLLNLRYLQKIGINEIELINNVKSTLLYTYLQQSNYFNIIPRSDLSKMNVCFRLKNENYTSQLIEFAASEGIIGIDGHRSIGGFRVSLYNAITIEHVEQLIRVMDKFVDKFHKVLNQL